MAVILPVVTLNQPFAMPETAEAIRQGALLVQATWIMLAQSGRFIHPQTGAYVRGIQTQESLVYPVNNNPLHAHVVNVAPHAEAIEMGTPGYHLPSVINWSSAKGAKQSKAGVWYMAIPFRHRAPGRAGGGATQATQNAMMPQQIYNAAKRLRPQQRLTAGPSRGRQVHAPGQTPYQPKYAANIRPGYQHASVYEGMKKTGAAGHTQYLTFRTMTSNSPGWHIPPRPGLHIAQAVANQTSPQVSSIVSDAVARDIAAYVQRVIGGGTP